MRNKGASREQFDRPSTVISPRGLHLLVRERSFTTDLWEMYSISRRQIRSGQAFPVWQMVTIQYILGIENEISRNPVMICTQSRSVPRHIRKRYSKEPRMACDDKTITPKFGMVVTAN